MFNIKTIITHLNSDRCNTQDDANSGKDPDGYITFILG